MSSRRDGRVPTRLPVGLPRVQAKFLEYLRCTGAYLRTYAGGDSPDGVPVVSSWARVGTHCIVYPL